jgi:small-conductance mechanosensitive channel
MPNKLIVSETIENLSEKRFEKIELMIEVPTAQDQQSPEGVIDSLEKEITRLEKKYEIQKSSVGIEKITTLATIVGVRLQVAAGSDIETMKKSLHQSVRKTKM